MTMKIRTLFLAAVLLCAPALSAEDNPAPVKKTIAILPFYNYAGSDLEYLSEFIPELMKERISIKGYGFTSPEEIAKQVPKTSPRELYRQGSARVVLKDLGAHIGITGRYIVQSKYIRIDYTVFDLTGIKPSFHTTYEDTLEDDIIPGLNKFAQKSASLVNEYVNEGVPGDTRQEVSEIMSGIVSSLKTSAIGSLLRDRWLMFIFILVLFYIISRLFMIFFDRILARITARTESNLDNMLISVLKKPVKWLIIFTGIKLAFLSLDLRNGNGRFIDDISSAVLILIITYIVSAIVNLVIRTWGKDVTGRIDSRINDDLVPLFSNVARVIIISIGILMVLSIFEINIAPLLASLGIAGFAIGFAIKDSLSNIIAGVILILDQSFAVGDKVVIEGDMGIIKEVGLRNTKLMTFDNEVIVIPNGDLMNKKFKNFVLPDPTIRVVVNFGVAYGSDVDRVEEVVLNEIRGIQGIAEEPEPAVIFTEMADFSLNMQAKFWVPDYVDQYAKWLEATKLIYKALVREGIDIPFPTHTVYVESGQK